MELQDEVAQPRTALVTGASGFAGRHLVSHLLGSTVWTVAGFSRSGIGGIDPDAGPGRLVDLRGDITNPADVAGAIKKVEPHYVFHLAARTPPAEDFDLLTTGVQGATVLLELVTKFAPGAAVLVVGSDAQYGLQQRSSLPTNEQAPMRPVTAYGRAKLLQERIALAYASWEGPRVVCVRPFNHVGPGQSPRFVIASIARQVARAEAGGPPVVELGAEHDRRDFTDVRDVVRAYLQALIMGANAEVYNIGSGVNHSIGEAAGLLTQMAAVTVGVTSVEERIRRGEPSETCCDATRLGSLTGWRPAIAFEETLRDTLDYFRKVETER